jgi:hypothetical protein
MSVDQVAVVLDDARLAAPIDVGLLSRQGSGAGEIQVPRRTIAAWE